VQLLADAAQRAGPLLPVQDRSDILAGQVGEAHDCLD
jgi:hypothetical protein